MGRRWARDFFQTVTGAKSGRAPPSIYGTKAIRISNFSWEGNCQTQWCTLSVKGLTRPRNIRIFCHRWTGSCVCIVCTQCKLSYGVGCDFEFRVVRSIRNSGNFQLFLLINFCHSRVSKIILFMFMNWLIMISEGMQKLLSKLEAQREFILFHV